jgi:inosine-uridine nucleoside N-ribohydrolase
MHFIRSSRKGLCGGEGLAAGLILAFFLTGCLSSTQSSTPTFQPVASATTAPSPTLQPVVVTTAPSPTQTQPIAFPLSGLWTGNAMNGAIKMQVTIILKEFCQVGDTCGTYDLSLPCSGTFTLVGETDGIYEFQAGNKTASCSGEGRDFLHLLPDGTLQYSSRGDYGETLGNLVRNDTNPTPQTAQKIAMFDDDDGSPDGTSALLYLLTQPSVDLKAVGISYGEAHPAVYIQHIGRMLDNFGFSNIPLGAGQDGPLSGSNGFPEWIRQAANTFWGWPIPNANKTYPVQNDADLIISVVKQSPEPVTLFFSGPFTNLALALRKAPEIRKNIAALYMMGGAVYVPGNVHDFYPDSANTYSDWNPYSDPQAAKEVFESGLKMYLIPLDATNQVQISKVDTSQWRTGGKIANFVANIYDGLMDSTGKKDFYIWDMMASEIMLNHDQCKFQPLHLDVVVEEGDHSGQTVVDPTGEPNINVCLEPNAALIRQTLIDTFSSSR